MPVTTYDTLSSISTISVPTATTYSSIINNNNIFTPLSNTSLLPIVQDNNSIISTSTFDVSSIVSELESINSNSVSVSSTNNNNSI